MKTIQKLLEEHDFFAGLNPEYLQLMAGCGKNVIFEAGAFIGREGAPEDYFYVLRRGQVTLSIQAAGSGTIPIQTLWPGDVLGYSWIFPPYKWKFNARADNKVHAISLNGKCLRDKCEENPQLGYDFLKLFSALLSERLEMTRLQLLDIYGFEPRSYHENKG